MEEDSPHRQAFLRCLRKSGNHSGEARGCPHPGEPERGTGIDKVVHAVEAHGLPAPVFENPPGSTRASLFAHKRFRNMDRQERLHACYMHACLRYVTQQPMTNSSLRARFKIADRNASTVSRILTDAVDKGLIVVADPAAGPRLRRYLPSWAGA